MIGFYIFLKRDQNPLTNPLHAVPLNTAMVLEIKYPVSFISQIRNNNELWKGLSQLEGLDRTNRFFGLVDSLIKNDEKLQTLFNKRSIILSINQTGKNQFDPLYLCSIPNRYEANQAISQITKLVPASEKTETKKYNQTKVYIFKTNHSPDSIIYLSYHRGILMASPFEILLQDAIRQVETESGIDDSPGFKRLMQTAGQHVDANMYIQFRNFSNLMELWFKTGFADTFGIKGFADWSELDLNLKSQTILLNGFAFSSDEKGKFMQVFQGQTPQSIKFPRIVPAGSNGFVGFGIDNIDLYLKNLRNYMEEIGERDRFNINEQQIIQAFGESSIQEIEAIFRNEFAQITLSDGTCLFAMGIRGYRDGNELLQRFFSRYTNKTHEAISSFRKDYSIDKESVFPIYRMPITYFPTRLLGPWFKNCSADYVATFDDYLIFSNSYAGLTRFIYTNILQKTVAYDADFNRFANFLTSKANFYLYANVTGNCSQAGQLLNEQGYAYFKRNKKTIRDFYAIGWQFSVENNLLYNNLLFRYQPSTQIKAATVWETRLDTLVAFKPALVTNHLTNEQEIFVQDLKNTIYLINKEGRIIWKRKLNEPIESEIFQVDFYKNGKLQYLFNTKHQLQLIDRNGNSVERYPIDLPSPASAPLNLFDYENRKNYRIFIPGADQQVHVFDIEGKRIAGFNFPGADNTIVSQVQYIRKGNKDYLAINDTSRIYIVNRQGETRIKLSKQFSPSVNNSFTYDSGVLVRTSTNGTIYSIDFDGNVTSKVIQKFTPDHFFNYQDIDNDGVSEYIFVDQNKLMVFERSGKMRFDYAFSNSITEHPAFYRFSAEKMTIGITESGAAKIYLIDKSGKLMNGFPLTGKTRFSIGMLDPGSGQFNLIVGGDEQYLYNYKLN